MNPIIAAFAVSVTDLPTVYVVAVLVAGFGMFNPFIERATGNRISGIATITITDLEVLWPGRRSPDRCGTRGEESTDD